ncbi:hypothetical protein MVEN_01135100 [Mycena venus]|uniref:Uncharacterized protein n=1 Tax=Mycena venus TaxID=2733690 RepID=A0A8H7CXR9_9AGAR|nr:hypothetical protein MVEN_01135100 [Mycena venus]
MHPKWRRSLAFDLKEEHGRDRFHTLYCVLAEEETADGQKDWQVHTIFLASVFVRQQIASWHVEVMKEVMFYATPAVRRASDKSFSQRDFLYQFSHSPALNALGTGVCRTGDWLDRSFVFTA